jgi:hypothetical protein
VQERIVAWATIAIGVLLLAGSGAGETLCGGQTMEDIVSPKAAQRAFNYLLYYPKGDEEEDIPREQTTREKSKQASVLLGASLLERGYRRRAEWELAKASPGEHQKERIAESEKAFLHAQEEFCKFVGHSLMQDFDKDGK